MLKKIVGPQNMNNLLSVAELEPEPMEPQLFWDTRAGANMNYFGSGSTAPEPELYFLWKILLYLKIKTNFYCNWEIFLVIIVL